MKRIFWAGAALLSITMISVAVAQMNHSDGHDMHAMHHQEGKIPTEVGQSAFASIAEIVEMLEADAETNWSKVDISALREHLVDMNNLTLNAKVTMEQKADVVTFQVTGEGKTLRAIQAMVPAHSGVLAEHGLYDATGEVTADGAKMVVKTADKSEMQKVKALGFFGLMATGAHHQPHHMQMATGGGHPH